MSKWMKNKKDLFNKFKDDKNKEKEQNGGINRNDLVWKTPERGTADVPKIYQLRLLMDTNDNFYKSYHYHMYYSTSAEKWVFVLCNKTFDFKTYCPFCAAVSKLYLGTTEDKKIAYNFKRKAKHCCNAFIVKDPRDVEKIDEEKSEGNVFIYEFPGKVESKIKQEMNDSEYGAGMNLFDPGKDGFDFILKVGATKPIKEGSNVGKVFPEYGDSKFANKPTSISDSDDAISIIMDKRHDLTEYLNTMKRTDEDLIELLKKEMLYDLIQDEYEARQKIKNLVNDEVKNSSSKTDETDEDESFGNDSDETNVSDADLLSELDDL